MKIGNLIYNKSALHKCGCGKIPYIDSIACQCNVWHYLFIGHDHMFHRFYRIWGALKTHYRENR